MSSHDLDTPQIVGPDVLRWITDEAELAARSDAKILLSGESGVGKDLVARFIHKKSARRSRAFVAINCAGVPDSLLESELFGHVRGSFTGAYRDKPGLFEQADGGAVFLDEVGEMSLRMQAMLLRFLEDGVISRVGADRPTGRVDVRVIAATNRDLAERVARQEFREDLYYRLNVIHLIIPPLRERRADVQPLIDHYMSTFCTKYRVELPVMSPEALAVMNGYDWPGNVRELRNVVERLVARLNGNVVLPQHLPGDLLKRAPRASGAVTAALAPVPSKGQEMVTRILEGGETFWTAVYAPFMAHDITRADVREVVEAGLLRTRGNYRMLIELFNMAPQDYKRVLAFLAKYQCHVPFHQFRATDPRTSNSRLASTA